MFPFERNSFKRLVPKCLNQNHDNFQRINPLNITQFDPRVSLLGN